MDKEKNNKNENQEESIITQQIAESYQSGLIEPEIDNRASEKK